MRSRTLLALVLLVSLMAFPESHGQKRVGSISFGSLGFDASGTGETYTVAARVALPVGGVFQLQPGLGYSPFDEQFSAGSTRMFFVDAFLRAQPASWRVRPFLGAGPVLAIYGTNASGRSSPETGYGVALGLDAGLGGTKVGILDLRFRGWQLNGLSPVNISMEATIGVGMAF